MIGLIHALRLALTCVWVIFCILIVAAQWLLSELRYRFYAWRTATTRLELLGMDRSVLRRHFVLSRLRVHSVVNLIVCTRVGWLLILSLSMGLLIIFTAG